MYFIIIIPLLLAVQKVWSLLWGTMVFNGSFPVWHPGGEAGAIM